jgi:uncharacterized membrane protein
MDLYTVLKYLHIVAAIVWLGGSTLFNVLGTMIIRKGDRGELQSFGERIEWLGHATSHRSRCWCCSLAWQ